MTTGATSSPTAFCESSATTAATGHGTSNEWLEFCAAHPALVRVEAILPDTNGILRGKWLPKSEAPRLWRSGMALPRSLFALDVWGREVTETALHLESGDRDGNCKPVGGSLCASDARGLYGQVLVSMEFEGKPCQLDPRVQLSRAIDEIARLGFRPVVAFELEFYLLDRRQFEETKLLVPAALSATPLRNMYSLSDLDQMRELFEDVTLQAKLQRLRVDTMLSEAAPGQYEVNLLHQGDALRAADEAVLLRKLVAAAAAQHGMLATFMPKPFIDQAGSGMHVHISLIDDNDTNIFASEKAGTQLLLSSVSGLLSTMSDMTLLFVPSFNGYKRLRRNSYAPTASNWGYDNRSVAIRIPNAERNARRLEHRIAGADANPYLVLAALLHGMAMGIEGRQAPPKATVGNAYSQGSSPLPLSLSDAITRFQGSAFANERFGSEYVSLISHLKTAELRRFESEVTTLELGTYLL